ncbi:MAG TPA: C40 family peptidase [Vicinamibacterales bacterium]|nr:C40 family peptidase [Vicinamibacterales bacterium]
MSIQPRRRPTGRACLAVARSANAGLAVPLLLTLLAGGCASSGAVPAPFPTPTPPASAPIPEPVPPPEERAPAVLPLPPVVGTALSLQGAPYRNGGSDPSGFDCSGFVAYVFAQQGLALPRTVSEQYDAGREISPDALVPGDLVFFSTVTRGPSHVGIAVSASEFVHAPSSSGAVRVERLTTPYWSSRFVGIRRVL